MLTAKENCFAPLKQMLLYNLHVSRRRRRIRLWRIRLWRVRLWRVRLRCVRLRCVRLRCVRLRCVRLWCLRLRLLRHSICKQALYLCQVIVRNRCIERRAQCLIVRDDADLIDRRRCLVRTAVDLYGISEHAIYINFLPEHRGHPLMRSLYLCKIADVLIRLRHQLDIRRRIGL